MLCKGGRFSGSGRGADVRATVGKVGMAGVADVAGPAVVSRCGECRRSPTDNGGHTGSVARIRSSRVLARSVMKRMECD